MQYVVEKSNNTDDVVKLNVGGQLKLVSKKVLTSVKDSILNQMFSVSFNLKSINDSIYIDRDPVIFDMVLNYLRNEGEYFPTMTSKEC